MFDHFLLQKCADILSSAWPRNVPQDLQTQQNTCKSFRTGETKTELFLTISRDFQRDSY